MSPAVCTLPASSEGCCRCWFSLPDQITDSHLVIVIMTVMVVVMMTVPMVVVVVMMVMIMVL